MSNVVNLSKLTAYALVQEGEKTSLTKLVPYALEQGSYGTVFQDVGANKPVYRDAPSGGVPYVDMSATSASLKVNVPVAGTYTLIVFKADQTFDVSEIDLVVGDQTLPVTDDFNQIAALFGSGLHRFTINAVKEGMKARI